MTDGIADRSTVGVFFGQANRYGDRPLVHHLVGGKWTVTTWAEMRRAVLAIGSALIGAGVKPGECVVIMSENRIEWLECDFAIQSIGAITVPIYPTSPIEIVQKIIDNSEPALAIASDSQMVSKLESDGSLRIVTMESEVASWLRQPPEHRCSIIDFDFDVL